MFDDPGRKIKTIANILFIVGVVGALILAFVVANAGYRFSFFTFLFSLGVISAGVYLSSLLLSAIGEALENLHSIAYQTKEINRILRLAQSNDVGDTKVSNSTFRLADLAKESKSRSSNGSEWHCKECGKWNAPSAKFCHDCGEPR